MMLKGWAKVNEICNFSSTNTKSLELIMHLFTCWGGRICWMFDVEYVEKINLTSHSRLAWTKSHFHSRQRMHTWVWVWIQKKKKLRKVKQFSSHSRLKSFNTHISLWIIILPAFYSCLWVSLEGSSLHICSATEAALWHGFCIMWIKKRSKKSLCGSTRWKKVFDLLYIKVHSFRQHHHRGASLFAERKSP